jgi:hypothetical protein
MKKENVEEVTLSFVIKQSVTFCVDDFDTREEFEEFILKLKSDEEFMLDHFYDNLDNERYEVINDVKVEE